MKLPEYYRTLTDCHCCNLNLDEQCYHRNQPIQSTTDPSDSSWLQRGDSKLVGASDFDKFGASLSLLADGLVLAVGAPYSNDGGAGLDSGSVQVFDYSDGNSYQARGPALYSAAYGDTFGWAVSLSNDGEILAVGAPKSNGIGYVKVYKYDGEKYNEVIHLSDQALFGYSISLSGDSKTLAVGTPEGFTTFGYSQLFIIDAESGVYDTYPESSTQYFTGHAVSISDDGNVFAAGDSLLSEVRVEVNTDDELLSYQLVYTIPGESVTVSGDGARFAVRNQTSAIVSVYSINATKLECLQIGQAIPITISPPPSSDSYDPTILMSLSNDGHVLVLANPLNTKGVQVYVETHNATGNPMYAASGDVIPIADSASVCLSDDGSVLAIGVPFSDLGNGQVEDNGSTFVYELPLQSRAGSTPPSTAVRRF